MISGAVGPGEHESETSSIWLVSILGGEPRRLSGEAYRAALSPDDSLVAYLSGHDSIVVADADGKNPREFIEREPWQWVGSPAWSSDGKRVVYRRVAASPAGMVATIESRGLEETTSIVLVTGEGNRDTESLVWAKDFLMMGDRLIYARDEPPPRIRDQNLWEVAIDPDSGRPTGQPKRLSDWVGFRIGTLSATADGTQLVFGNDRSQDDVYVGALDDGGRVLDDPRRLTLDDRNDSPCGWTPDGRAVVFQSDRYGNEDLFMQELDQRTARDLATGAGDQVEARLTPDGADFLYWESEVDAGGPADPRRLLRVPVGGGPTKLVFESDGWAWHACATTPDGQCLLFELLLEAGAITLSRLDPLAGRGEELRRVLLDPTVTPKVALSPDGSRLAMIGHVENGSSIRVLESLTGEIVRDIDIDDPSGLEPLDVAWSSDGRGFFLSAESPRANVLLHVDPRGEARVLYEAPRGDLHTVTPSPDGRHLAFGKTIWDTNVWKIDNF